MGNKKLWLELFDFTFEEQAEIDAKVLHYFRTSRTLDEVVKKLNEEYENNHLAYAMLKLGILHATMLSYNPTQFDDLTKDIEFLLKLDYHAGYEFLREFIITRLTREDKEETNANDTDASIF